MLPFSFIDDVTQVNAHMHKHESIFPTPHIIMHTHTHAYTLLTTKHILLVFLP